MARLTFAALLFALKTIPPVGARPSIVPGRATRERQSVEAACVVRAVVHGFSRLVVYTRVMMRTSSCIAPTPPPECSFSGIGNANALLLSSWETRADYARL